MLPISSISRNVTTITGERGEVHSEEEVLGPKNVAKTYVPMLSSHKVVGVSSDHDHPDGQHQSEV